MSQLQKKLYVHLSDVVGVEGVGQTAVAARLHHCAHRVCLAQFVLLRIEKLNLINCQQGSHLHHPLSSPCAPDGDRDHSENN